MAFGEVGKFLQDTFKTSVPSALFFIIYNVYLRVISANGLGLDYYYYFFALTPFWLAI